jgi:uncharacterized FlaG/YvyC family protein
MELSSISNISSLLPVPASHGLPQPIGADQRALVQAVRAVNAAQLLGQDKELTFLKDRETQKTVVRIVSKDTGELVAQIPAENVLLMAEEVNGSQ